MKKIEIRRIDGGFHLIVDGARGPTEKLVPDLPELLSVIAKEYGHMGRVWLEPVWMLMVRPAARWGIRINGMFEQCGETIQLGVKRGRERAKEKRRQRRKDD